MLRRLNRWLRAAYLDSPRDNLSRLGRQLHRWTRGRPSAHAADCNCVVAGAGLSAARQGFLLHRLGSGPRPLVLLGPPSTVRPLKAACDRAGRPAATRAWDWDGGVRLDDCPPDATVLVCAVPVTESQWRAFGELKASRPGRVVGVQELVQPFTAVETAYRLLEYAHPSLEAVGAYYRGECYFGPIEVLDRAFPLAGKTVIEFGPLDGYQTAGLVKAGAKSVTAVEGRPENYIKTLVARATFGWDNVRLVLDDFHNADRSRYGRFDLAFAHGVYYHSNSPFVFLDNLVGLADAVFVGGYCATDDHPDRPYDRLGCGGETYRAKPYWEEVERFTAGVNRVGYFFHGEDLMAFFARRGYETVVISDDRTGPPQPAGRYLRFLARRGV